MPATIPVRPASASPRSRRSLLVQLGLAAVLLLGLRVEVLGRSELVSQLDRHLASATSAASAASAGALACREACDLRRSAGRAEADRRFAGPVRRTPCRSPTPIVALRPTAPVSGGGSAAGPATGSGAGGGSGGQGYGADDDGGTDLVQIAGEIRPSDYPRDLRERGIGGHVGMVFTVGANGRVTNCTVTRSSGVPELNSLTCRLIQQRFRYRPSTDRYGRPIPDEVEGEHDWVAGRG